MRDLSDENKVMFLKAKLRNDGTFVLEPSRKANIKNDMDLTVYAKPIDKSNRISKFSVGSGKVQQGDTITLKLTHQDKRIKLNNDLQYFVRVPKKKHPLQLRLLRALNLDESDDS